MSAARNVLISSVIVCSGFGTPALAQDAAGAQAGQQQPAPAVPSWTFMQDGVLYGLFNRQGGPRGGDEFVAPNWWMGMAMKESGRHQFTLNGMFSVDAATVGKEGYREIFQVGEALDGKPLVDRQHPHDFLMQLAASWRLSLGDTRAVTFAAGAAGEPTIGPVAFMHRPSAAGLPFAPLGHHTFDSTHVAFGVVTASLRAGKWSAEASVFNGREPDEDRWDFDAGRMDSLAARLWFRPSASWELQVSTAHLREPEQLEEGDVQRTTTSAAWFRPSDSGFAAFTGGYGVNAAHGVMRHGTFGEATIERGRNSFSGRLELQQLEIAKLAGHAQEDEHHDERGAVAALTLGAGRRLLTWRGFEGALAAQATVSRSPAVLKSTHGSHPVSWQVFFRLRLPAGAMGRMWNMRMSEPMAGHAADPHAGHVMR